jgi:hypothetical protein
MSDIPLLRRNVQVEETAYKAAVSESTWNKIGGSINFINERQTMKYEFGILKGMTGTTAATYAGTSTPFTDFGTQEIFPYAAEIIAVVCYHGDAGSSGTTEIDLKWQPVNSTSSFATIFTTTPKVTSSAASERYWDSLGNNTTPTGCTAPVLSKTTFAAGDKVRCDIVSVMGGTPNAFTVTIYFRPI